MHSSQNKIFTEDRFVVSENENEDDPIVHVRRPLLLTDK